MFTPTGYALAQEGFSCKDIGMKATEELESCKAAMYTIQKIIPDIGEWDNIAKGYVRAHNQPKGCSVADNKIYLNTDDTDFLSAGSRQVCSGKLPNKLHAYEDIRCFLYIVLLSYYSNYISIFDFHPFRAKM